jgi:2-amino-4-hydroxy-6-hydroxymethyldihydropteridine diphosphokinase
LGVGSNLSPEENVPAALELLSWEMDITGISTFYQTPPLGNPSAPPFINGVLEVHTTLSEEGLLELLARVEGLLGRVREADKYAPRTMDLDLLVYFPAVELEGSVSQPGTSAPQPLSHPHPDVFSRPWVAVPLFELDPRLLLPPDNRPIREVSKQFLDPGGEGLYDLTDDLKERFLKA